MVAISEIDILLENDNTLLSNILTDLTLGFGIHAANADK